jgi:penicillin-binding protein 1A
MPSLSALGKLVAKFCARLAMLCLRILGAIFSSLTLAAVFGAAVLGAIFLIYGQGLPSHDELASYQPKTISRIYSGEGHIIDEFATERRIFASADEIPDLVKAAFISAEDKNFYSHAGYDPCWDGGSAARCHRLARVQFARRLDHHTTGDEKLPVGRIALCRA